jgi:hypothetical protein
MFFFGSEFSFIRFRTLVLALPFSKARKPKKKLAVTDLVLMLADAAISAPSTLSY